VTNHRYVVPALLRTAFGLMTIAIALTARPAQGLAAEQEKALAAAAPRACITVDDITADAGDRCSVVATRRKFVLADLVAADFGDNDEPAR
jgi:hypothetical protein